MPDERTGPANERLQVGMAIEQKVDAATDIVERLFAAMASMDQEAVVACFEPEVKAHFHPSRRPEIGHHALRLAFQTLASAFSSIAPVEVQRMDTGRILAVHWVSRGTPQQDAPMAVAGVLVLKRGPSGRIAAFWNHFVPA